MPCMADTDIWAKANELRAEAHRLYGELTGPHVAGEAGRDDALKKWQAAHRAWWDEVQRVLGKAAAAAVRRGPSYEEIPVLGDE